MKKIILTNRKDKINLLKPILIVLLCSLGYRGLQAQNAVSTAGGNISGGGGSASYSVGQVVYSAYTGTNGFITQGVQQPFEISVITGLDRAEGINLFCSAYPNPTTDFLILKVENCSNTNLSYQLFDNDGKLLEAKKIADNQATIIMSNLVQATYLLKVRDGTRVIKTFKIIKK